MTFPANPFVRFLFYCRLTFIGAGPAITFLRHEENVLEWYFENVEKIVALAGRSKVMICPGKFATFGTPVSTGSLATKRI